MSTPAIRRKRRRGARVLVGVNLALAALMLCGWIPGPVGTAVAVLLPGLGVIAIVVTLATLLLVRRAAIPASAAVAVFLIAAAPAMPAFASTPGTTSISIVSQNVRAQSGSGAASAQDLIAQHPDVVTLTELDAESRTAAADVLEESYPYSYAVGTVGVWSRHPLTDGEPLDLGLGWNRALRVTVQAPTGDTVVYLVHAASVRPGAQDARDEMLAELAATVRDDDAPRVIALGDFNAATTDPALLPLSAELTRARSTDGGTGFTWPAGFPVVRIDHVFQRGFAVARSDTLRAGTSDHLAVLATLTVD